MINLKGKTALVTGISDNVGFGFHIAKTLAEAGADIIVSCHPRLESIVERFLEKEKYAESRKFNNNKGEFKAKYIVPCDAGLDSSIKDLFEKLSQNNEKIDILVHSLAFSPEIDKKHIDVSREGYLTAVSISAYSLISLCKNLLPLMANRQASVMALSYLAAERAVPFYGGGMASAKAALESDVRMLSWSLGELGHRINTISPGPYASRAAKSIGDIDEMISRVEKKSPLRRAISAQDVANTALFLASDLSLAITGEIIHVDAGFHAMALA
jgi:enoyl-[acyl-carrier protein] reductase I